MENTYVEENKKVFLDLVGSISKTRLPDKNREKLNKWIVENSDFFEAPASTKYHSNFKGGLCVHSLNVYFILKKLVEDFIPKEQKDQYWNDDKIKILGLFHDISKANFYEEYNRNVKNEKTNQWEQVKNYRTKDVDSRFIYGSHEQTSEFILSSFIDLTLDEKVAILHHHGGMGFDSTKTDISTIFIKYPISLLLHEADMIATYLTENEKM